MAIRLGPHTNVNRRFECTRFYETIKRTAAFLLRAWRHVVAAVMRYHSSRGLHNHFLRAWGRRKLYHGIPDGPKKEPSPRCRGRLYHVIIFLRFTLFHFCYLAFFFLGRVETHEVAGFFIWRNGPTSRCKKRACGVLTTGTPPFVLAIQIVNLIRSTCNKLSLYHSVYPP